MWWTDDNTRGRRLPRGLLPILLVLALAPTARAAGQADCPRVPQCRRHYDEALRHYDAGAFEAALQQFQLAYSITPSPTLLLNIGRTQHRLAQPTLALATYRRFRELVPEPDAETARKLADFTSQAQRLEAEQEAAKAPPPPTLAPAPAPDPVPVVAAVVAPRPAPPPPTRPRWRLAVGVSALAAGAVVGGLGVSALAVNGSCIDVGACGPRFDTTGIGAGLLVPGLLLAGAGVALLAWPPPRATERR